MRSAALIASRVGRLRATESSVGVAEPPATLSARSPSRTGALASACRVPSTFQPSAVTQTSRSNSGCPESTRCPRIV